MSTFLSELHICVNWSNISHTYTRKFRHVSSRDTARVCAGYDIYENETLCCVHSSYGSLAWSFKVR